VSYAISSYLSGGGFSSVDDRPAYQDAAVNAYFNSGVKLPPDGVYNRTGRGFPDVAAIGYNGYIIDGGNEGLVSGTSMSTPIVAATFALLQADYKQHTGHTLGFLNQILYRGVVSNPTIFTDITIGDNCRTTACTNTDGLDGFLTAKGWDPVTGLGSPYYPALKAYLSSLAEEEVHRRSVAAVSTQTPLTRRARHTEGPNRERPTRTGQAKTKKQGRQSGAGKHQGRKQKKSSKQEQKQSETE